MTNTGLGGSTQPEVDLRFYDLEKPDAEIIANIVHEQRSLAAGSRAVSVVLSESPAINYDELSFKERNELAESLFEVHGVYPEVFSHGGHFSSRETVTEDVLVKRLPDILRHKGLPVLYHDVGSSLGQPEDYDERADLMEEVALALISNMPSIDFLRHHDIKYSFPGPTVEDLVGQVVGLLGSETYYLEEAEYYERHYGGRLEEINSGEIDPEKPRSERYAGFISCTMALMDEEDRQAFAEEYTAAGNNLQTTVDDIKSLAQRSISVLVNRYQTKASKKREAFDIVMSGQAASYRP